MTPLLLLLALAPALQAERSDTDAENERLERALDLLEEARLRADLEFLAADEMGGRDTPSEELAIAALFLRARLQRLGFEPPREGRWFAPFELVNRGLDLERSVLRLSSAAGDETLLFGNDYFFARTGHVYGSEARGEAVSVGSGSRDEFEAAELEGAWAVLFDTGASTRRATRYAQKAGAAGLMILENLEVSKPFVERYRSQTRIAKQANVGYRNFAGRRAVEEPPVVLLSADAREKLLGSTELTWEGDFPPAGTRLGVDVEEVRAVLGEKILVNNVAGLWRGDDPELAREVIVVSAHYDHIGAKGGEVFNGADDNASGTTGLLGIAEALAAYGPLRRSVLLLWVSGEEKGLWGSHAWAQAPVLPDGFVAVADINVDMIGRTEPEELYVTPSRDHASYNALSRAAYELCAQEGFPVLASQDADWARSDHFNFDKLLEIPVVFLSAGEHEDYHRATDTADKIDFDKLRRVARLVVRILDRVQDQPLERNGG